MPELLEPKKWCPVPLAARTPKLMLGSPISIYDNERKDNDISETVNSGSKEGREKAKKKGRTGSKDGRTEGRKGGRKKGGKNSEVREQGSKERRK